MYNKYQKYKLKYLKMKQLIGGGGKRQYEDSDSYKIEPLPKKPVQVSPTIMSPPVYTPPSENVMDSLKKIDKYKKFYGHVNRTLEFSTES